MSIILKPVKPEHQIVGLHAHTTNASTVRRSPEYLAQLLSDKKQLQVFPKVFIHLEKILDDEISKVRSNLFHVTDDNGNMRLPQAIGAVVTLTEKLNVPVADYPDLIEMSDDM